MSGQVDFFLSHNWGTDEVGRDNHARVQKVNDAIKNLAFTTWFDEEQMSGDTVDQMSRGIENSQVCLVFLTSAYHKKVNGENSADNCKLEFNHAVRVLKTGNILPIVMDSSMSKTSDWKGAIGFHLGNKLYVNMTGNLNDPTYLEDKVQEVLNIVKTFPNMHDDQADIAQATAGAAKEEAVLSKEQKGNEIKAKRAASSRGQIKYTVTFTNKHDEDVDLIWKNYEGGEVRVRQGISPGQSHSECSYFTHPFIARDVITEQVCLFVKGGLRKPVFEGMDFGAPHNGKISVDIV